ncbi:MAG: flavodoxin-dependent (E)-4-hydroxy-3-methylbut-2-enyl-diphosphate synthase [Ruminococcaceae bacterium]|nr:flavodoxin-dependent (E)-4-hydroxy-3-methylbut-2-enyl-diphosphate synthase [Oscillospiraceae bacterium]
MNTKEIKIGNRVIGGNNPVLIQSMCNVKTADYEKCIEQIHALEEAGCDIIRVAVPNIESAKAISKIKTKISIPLVADIHFDYKLALESIENGVDKIRINPGNIGSEDGIKQLVKKAKERNIPIRIGVNGGSLEKDILEKYSHPTPEAMVESAKRHVKILNKFDFDDIIISLKASNVKNTVDVYRLASKEFNYPLHLGVTEAGTYLSGTVKSAIGIGTLLNEKIGDTIRVSLTDDPINEVIVAKEILKSLNMLTNEPTLVSCPTCARCNINLIELAQKVEKYLQNVKKPIKVAVMGCVVNGPGEAKEADVGIAGGLGNGILFKKGEIIKKVSEDMLFDTLVEEIEKM